MIINKIFLFDDREYVMATPDHIKLIRKRVCERLRERNLGIKIENEETFYAEEYICYIADGGNEVQKKRTEDGEEQKNWLDHMENLEFARTLVLCDYDWSAANRGDVFLSIYNQIKDNESVVFACYSTIRYEEAQDKVNSLYREAHQCKLIGEVMTSENDPTDFVVSLQEAIQYDWKKI